jgi:hypothetical protein
LHSYIDPNDSVDKATHLLKDYRQFLDIQKFCDELRSESEAKARSAEERTVAYSYPQQYTPGEDIYIPTEVYPQQPGQCW